MPFEVRKQDGKFCVFTVGTDHNHGCHPSEAEAMAQLRALYANLPEARMGKSMDDFLACFGGEVKALGGGKVGGYLVRFGSAQEPDTSQFRDFFTAKTDFGTEFPAATAVYYNHGLDSTLARRRLADGAKMKADEIGIWVEAQLKLRDEWERAVYDLAKAGKLSWSSGTANHLVERAAVKSAAGETIAHEILAWPLGLDASLTPTPAEPRCEAVALKSGDVPELSALVHGGDACPECGANPSLARDLDELIAGAKSAGTRLSELALKEGRSLSASRRERLSSLVSELQAILAETTPRQRDAVVPTATAMEATTITLPAAEVAEAMTPTLPDLRDLFTSRIVADESGLGWLGG